MANRRKERRLVRGAVARSLDRRSVLRGMVGGAAVTVALPFFDVLLNDHGDAFAQGAPLPVRFGTWFWGNGMNPDRWVPPTDGADYELSPELMAIAPVKEQISILSGFDALLDGSANIPHWSGIMAHLTGVAPDVDLQAPGATFDTLIAAEIGSTTRFRSLELNATGRRDDSYSRQSESIINPSEISPIEAYARIFGPEFYDPNEGPFVPDPRVMLRQSVLTAVKDDRERLNQLLGSHDRQRLDQYLTSVRQLENQLQILLSEPPDLAACARPMEPNRENIGEEISQATATHEAMTDLLVMALACDQTRVFNMMFSWGLSTLRKQGTNISHHQRTHDEAVDPVLGYQPDVQEFILISMDAWALFVQKLAAVSEGDGTLLDNCLVYAHSESSFAKIHDVRDLPIMIAGRAGGALTPGLHVRGEGEPVSRIALTVQQVMGLGVERWGTRSLETNRPVTELLA